LYEHDLLQTNVLPEAQTTNNNKHLRRLFEIQQVFMESLASFASTLLAGNLEILEMSGNLTTAGEMSGKCQGKILSGKTVYMLTSHLGQH